MEINEETYKLFDRYFTDNLSAEERLDFEKALSVDENFRNEFQWLSLAVSEIRMNGKTILKKQLAAIGAAIPASAFEKYSPSIKPKNFFKKWWWAIAVTVAAAGLTIAWLAMRGPEGEKSHGDVAADMPATDTLMKTIEKDAATASPFGVPESPTDTVKDGSVFDDNNCCTYSVRVFQNPDTVGIFDNRADTAYKWHTVSGSSHYTLVGIVVQCCPQKDKPPFYTYKDQGFLSLSATYADTSDLRFIQHGNALMMTDGKPGYFILTKGAKEMPLVRIDARKGFIYSPEHEPTIRQEPKKK